MPTSALDLPRKPLRKYVAKQQLEHPALSIALASTRPRLADELRKVAEANRSVAMTVEGLKRDQKVLERLAMAGHKRFSM